jgi:hypothetical protein
MKDLFEPAAVAEVKERLRHLRPDSPRQWGTMNASQAVEHCARGLELVTGTRRPPRVLIGRLIGSAIRRLALGNDAPMRRNSPTVPDMVVAGTPDLHVERERLLSLIDQVAAAGPAGCTTHPHSFFGRLTPKEWGVLMYKHLDHHLRQFGA